MPQCRNCHREISKFDNDVCPYCGCEHPIDANYQTKDMTQFVDPVTGDYKLYKSKSKKTAGFLCMGLGWAGIDQFYLGFWKKGLLSILITLLITIGGGFILYYNVNDLNNYFAFLIAFRFDWVGFASYSAKIFKNDSAKDSNGEFLR